MARRESSRVRPCAHAARPPPPGSFLLRRSPGATPAEPAVERRRPRRRDVPFREGEQRWRLEAPLPARHLRRGRPAPGQPPGGAHQEEAVHGGAGQLDRVDEDEQEERGRHPQDNDEDREEGDDADEGRRAERGGGPDEEGGEQEQLLQQGGGGGREGHRAETGEG